METFGLFDLLKSLLPARQEETSAPPPSSETATQSPPPNAQTSAPEKTSPPEPDEPNACVDFLNRHEELAKRRKRK